MDGPTVISFPDVFHATRHRQSVCILAVLTWVAGCDGRIGRREQELLDRIAEAVDDPEELAAVESAMREPRRQDLELACRHLRTNLDRGGRRLLAQLAVTTVVQDGPTTVSEILVLQFLADLLGISPRRFARLFHQTARRPFPIPGDPSSAEWWTARFESAAFEEEGEDTPEADEPMTRATALRILNLDGDESREAIHRAYRRLARARHPDRFARLGPSAVAAASEAFKRLHEAYAFLSAGGPS